MFGLLVSECPELFDNQPDFVSPTTIDKTVVAYYDANNLTAYENTWSFTLTYPDGYAYNQSGLPTDHRIEVFWFNAGTAFNPYPILQFKHAYPSPLGSWWLWSNYMTMQEPYLTQMGEPDNELTPPNGYIDKTQLLRLSDNGQSAFFIVSDGEITQSFAVMAMNDSLTLGQSFDAGELRILSTYDLDFDAMKPNAFWLMAQLITFQNPNFGLPDVFGQILNYGLALAFWFVIALLLYTIVTKLIPTIQGGIEN